MPPATHLALVHALVADRLRAAAAARRALGLRAPALRGDR
jgi:hypothetical protein